MIRNAACWGVANDQHSERLISHVVLARGNVAVLTRLGLEIFVTAG